MDNKFDNLVMVMAGILLFLLFIHVIAITSIAKDARRMSKWLAEPESTQINITEEWQD